MSFFLLSMCLDSLIRAGKVTELMGFELDVDINLIVGSKNPTQACECELGNCRTRES